MTSFFIYLISSYGSVLSYTLLNEPYSSQLIGGASELDQHATILCLLPSLSPYWAFKLTMCMRQASRYQLCWQRRPLREMGSVVPVCGIHQRKHQREPSVVFRLLYLVWTAFVLRCVGEWGLSPVYWQGGGSLNRVPCQGMKGCWFFFLFCQVFSQNSVLNNLTHAQVSSFEWHPNVSS